MAKIFKWLSSPADRGNITLTYGNIYNNDELAKPIDPESYATWEREGVLKPVDSMDAVEEEPEPEPKPTPPPKEHVGIKDIGELSEGSDDFSCPHEDCEKHEDPYKSQYHFINHMSKMHDEEWVFEDGKLKKEA